MNFKRWLEAIGPLDVLDWLLVALLLFTVFRLIRRTRAVLLIRGFLILVAAWFLSSLAKLTLLNFILNKVLIGVAVAIPILFQPELRKLMEQLGRGDFLTGLLPNPRALTPAGVEALALLEVVQELAQQRIGALIVLERSLLDERLLASSGTVLEAVLSPELLLAIFNPKSPLHDGAVVIRESRVWAAGVILPITTQITSKQLGTRHRAAIGISEQSDSHCIVVSEETGSISYAVGGNLQRPLTPEQLKTLLVKTPTMVTAPLLLPGWLRNFFFPGNPNRTR